MLGHFPHVVTAPSATESPVTWQQIIARMLPG